MAFISPVATDASGAARTTGSMQKLDKNDFLQLLVAKLQNQDPLKPMEDQDFIAQLAQFSSLEQMNNIAEGIASSNKFDFLQMQSINNTMAAGLIGKDVKAEYSTLYADGQSDATISFTMPTHADTVTFVIRDSSGNAVAQLTEENVPPGAQSIKWDGRDKLGNMVLEGIYSIEARATDVNGNSVEPKLSLIGRVESIFYRDGAALLRVNGTEIPLGDVTAIGEPGSLDEG
ncbi:MAG: flagellar hook assembly protein FlgD [Candidatus Zixiibacteriota bacterium]